MQYLYKYFRINEDLISSLENSKIWFSKPDDFNDPFDSKIKCKYVKDQYYEERKKLTMREAYNEAISNESYIKESLDLNRMQLGHEKRRMEKTQELHSIFMEQVKTSGVACYSKNYDNILMWSHYSDNHKGVCVKFNKSDQEFFKISSEVKYTDKFPDSQELLDAKDPSTFLFSTKSDCWSYEQEVRVIKPITGLVSFKPDSLEAVYFGVKCSNTAIQEIRDLVAKNYHKVSFYKMELSGDRFALEVQKLK